MLLNSSYYLSPLLLAYDAHFSNMENDSKKLNQDCEALRDMNRKLMGENDILAQKCEKQNM